MTPRRIATVLWMTAFVLVIVLPLVGLVLGGDGGSASTPVLHGSVDLVLTTVVWSLGIAVLATALAIPAARVLAGMTRHRGLLVAAVVLPVLMPSWALFYAWWTSWPPGSGFFAWAADRDLVGVMRGVTLGMSMVAVTWPVAVVCVLGGSTRWTRSRRDLLVADGASAWRCCAARLRLESPALLVAVLVSAVLVASATTAFDLAGIYTISNALRSVADGGGSMGALAAMAWPLMPLAVLAAVAVWWWLGHDAHEPGVAARSTGVGPWATLLIWIVLVATPVVLLVYSSSTAPGNVLAQHGPAMLSAFGRAAIVGGVTTLATLIVAGQGRRTGWWFRLMAVVWLAVAMLPTPVTAAATAAIWSRLSPEVLSWGLAWTLGLLIRAGALGVIGGRWAARSQPAAISDLRMLDAMPWWRPGPTTLWMALGMGVVAMAMAVGDVVMVSRLAPPMSEPPLAVTLLNAIHYQRPETVAQILLVCVVLAIVATVLCGLAVRAARVSMLVLIGALCVVHLPGCASEEERESRWSPLPSTRQVGLPGRSIGRFITPRAIASDSVGGFWVVDKSARVQRVDVEGAFVSEWSMPAFDDGKPVGLGRAPDGRLIVADTHEHRVACFQDDGTLAWEVGRYGQEAGAFIYPTDVVFDRDGLMYVSEYGGNDRIQVFDAQRRWIRTLGGPGESPGAFRRVQSMSFAPDERTLWVADSGNHRIQGLHPQTGELLAVFGSDWLRYPYGVASLPDGTLLVTEFGGHRLSRWTPSGERLGVWGGWGRADGQLRMPWGVCHDPLTNMVHVLDSGNARVSSMPLDALNDHRR